MPAWSSLFTLLAASAPQVLASCAYGTHLHPRAEAFEEPKFGYNGIKVSFSIRSPSHFKRHPSVKPHNMHKTLKTLYPRCIFQGSQNPNSC